jgi:hypothetical protein
MNDDLDEENMINMAKSEEQEGEGSAESWEVAYYIS